MATTAVTPVHMMNFNEISANLEFKTAATPADGFALDLSGKDYKIAILVKSSAAGGTITVKAGDGIQGVADYVSGAIGNGEERAIVLESGAFMNVTGPNKGKVIIIPSAATVTIAAVQLP